MAAEPSRTQEAAARLIRSWLHTLALALAVIVALAPISTTQAGLSGAIFTTNADSTFVNANVYENAADVYLNGGPGVNQSCTAASLPDGDYLFQVTDPLGQDPLSLDSIDARRLTVLGGIITASTHHTGGPGRCGGVTVQLCPFKATTNEGDEYKVWVTPVIGFNSAFSRSASKTDNFKVTGSDFTCSSD